MNNNWIWIGKYLVVIAAALVLGAVLGSLALFKGATLGSPKLTAGALVQFIAHGGALALLWLLGQRLSGQLRTASGGTARLADSVLALVTLLVAASAYLVLIRFSQPFLGSDLKAAVDWLFILGILAAAVWLVWALFKDAESIIAAFSKVRAKSA